MKRLLILMGMMVMAVGLYAAKPPAVGSDAPKLKVTVETGESLELGALYDKGTLVVFFYPKALTGGCTAQACSLRDAYEALTRKGIAVIGVSRDGVEAQKQFKEQNHLPFPLISDVDGSVMRGFGVREVASGIAAREAFIIQAGKIVWHDNKASTHQQAHDIWKALKLLQTEEE